MRRVAIIGAGPSGLSAAFSLTRPQPQNASISSITIFDASSKVGGAARTVWHRGVPYDMGPILLHKEGLTREILVEALGVDLVPFLTRDIARTAMRRLKAGGRHSMSSIALASAKYETHRRTRGRKRWDYETEPLSSRTTEDMIREMDLEPIRDIFETAIVRFGYARSLSALPADIALDHVRLAQRSSLSKAVGGVEGAFVRLADYLGTTGRVSFLLNTRVTEVSPTGEVHFRRGDGFLGVEAFDAVIVAAPPAFLLPAGSLVASPWYGTVLFEYTGERLPAITILDDGSLCFVLAGEGNVATAYLYPRGEEGAVTTVALWLSRERRALQRVLAAHASHHWISLADRSALEALKVSHPRVFVASSVRTFGTVDAALTAGRWAAEEAQRALNPAAR